MNKKVLLGHGSGGTLSDKLIKDLFLKRLGNDFLDELPDSVILKSEAKELAFTTDSFVVDPLFFAGGDIGRLAVCGTVNDLAVSGATPKYLSLGVIIEEGLEFEVLERIVDSIALAAKEAGVQIVTGDTKVVDKGKCDKIFINTSGIGFFEYNYKSSISNVEIGDEIIINGSIADHGMSVMLAREEMGFSGKIETDAAPLNGMIKLLLESGVKLKFMRDATRGGLATVLTEIAEKSGFTLEIEESAIPIKSEVNGVCELLGFDPMFVANEGKVVIVIAKNDTARALEILKSHNYGINSYKIGKVIEKKAAKVILKTEIGGSRVIDKLAGEQLPRIC